jgi:ribulose-5-phosphate 4-epimerase/fuculose-1-phosphate aldolase
MVSANLTELFATYINALHILHAYRVLDGYGHLSVRNPNNASTFFLMRELAPAMVSGRDDIGEYRILDAESVDPSQPDTPAEKYIHSEILKRYQDVNVVLHGHANELVRSSIADVSFGAVIHTAPFLGMSPG